MTKIYFLLVFIVSLIIAIMTNNIDTLNETDGTFGTNHIPRLLNIFTVVKFANTECNSSLGRLKYFEKKS